MLSPEASSSGDGHEAVLSPMVATVVALMTVSGDVVRAGQVLVVLESMKLEHEIAAPSAGVIHLVHVEVGATVAEGAPLVVIRPGVAGQDALASAAPVDDAAGEAAAAPALVRADLAEVLERQSRTGDERRPAAVERRRRSGHRTARENVADLCDPGSFEEYGSLVLAAQRGRRSLDDLIAETPGDGLVGGLGRVNGAHFDDERARCVVVAYDPTVLAGTQGFKNHQKKDRLFELAERLQAPVVLFAEGGGGRPGDTDVVNVAGLDLTTFAQFARLSGLVPLVGIANRYCFAGNAALLGCCDVVIATEGSSIGMGGPAMIEGGGLGVVAPEAVGPMDVQVPNGVVDVLVADEAAAVAVAKQYLSYFQGPLAAWSCADQTQLRAVIPESRLRVYDVRRVISLMADEGSVLELRPSFGLGMVTALVRIEGRAIGIIANNPSYLAGAITSDGADKAARFLQLCDAFDVPVLMLCDTPGMMVGPDVERTALVRHCSRLFVVGASISVPLITVVLRKGYGLGAMAMAGGSFRSPMATVAWPTAEFGGMGLEGAVRLGYRKELEAIADPVEREALFQKLVGRMYEHGKAVSMATYFEIDDVIDPADTRQRVIGALRAAPPVPVRTGKKRACIDPW